MSPLSSLTYQTTATASSSAAPLDGHPGGGVGQAILGPIFNLWDWILGISPFYHVPIVTSADADFTGWWIVVGVLALLTTVGFVGFRRRDLA